MFKKFVVFTFAVVFLSNALSLKAQTASTRKIAEVKFKLSDFRNPSQLRGRFGLLQFSPDGSRLATSGTARDLKIYDTSSGQVLATLDGDRYGFNAFSFSPDGKTAIAQDADFSQVRVFDVENGKLLKAIDGSGRYAASKKAQSNAAKGLVGLEMSAAPVTPDWKTVLIQKNEGEYETVDVETNTVTHKFEHSQKSSAVKDFFKTLFVPFTYVLLANANFSPDGKYIVVANGNESPTLWNVENGNLIGKLEPQDNRVYLAVFSPDSQLVATSNTDGITKIWETASGKMLASVGSKKDKMFISAWSADSRKLVTFSYKLEFASLSFRKDMPFWDARTGEQLFALKNSEAEIAYFSSDGTLVATGNRGDKSIMAQIWNSETGELLASLPREKDEDRALSLVWSPDGKYLVAPTPQNVKIWSAKGEFIQSLDNAVFPARFSSDGKLLATGGKNDVGYVWQIGE